MKRESKDVHGFTRICPWKSTWKKVPVADCTIHFHPRAGMEKNVKALHLEERYERHKATAHKYLLLRQQ